MFLITDINDIPFLNCPSALAIGSFDGVHLGHQTLFQHLRAKLPPHGILTALTFSNHPSHIFTPKSPIPLISPPLQKVKHLFDYGIDIVIFLPFTKEFANISFKTLLTQLHSSLSFSHLAFGTGAVLGKNREGD